MKKDVNLFEYVEGLKLENLVTAVIVYLGKNRTKGLIDDLLGTDQFKVHEGLEFKQQKYERQDDLIAYYDIKIYGNGVSLIFENKFDASFTNTNGINQILKYHRLLKEESENKKIILIVGLRRNEDYYISQLNSVFALSKSFVPNKGILIEGIYIYLKYWDDIVKSVTANFTPSCVPLKS